MDGGGSITRSIGGAATSGFIRGDAAHWSIESFIPIQTDALVQYLIDRPETTTALKSRFRKTSAEIEGILRNRAASYHARFAHRYWPLDPDNDSRTPQTAVLADAAGKAEIEPEQASPAAASRDVAELLDLCHEFLSESGYRRVQREDIQRCVGVASQWGVPLHVDFDLFEQLHVYARGDVVGTKLRRRLRRLYQPEQVSVPIYQRMFVLFQLTDDNDTQEELLASSVHLRMFKNIPKQDVDMLLPCTRVRITKIDHVKILLPSLGGILLSLRKIVQFMLIFAALTLYSSAVLVGLVLATIGYVVKSVLGYFQTKNRYLLNLTRNLYFQKLDTNAGAAYRVIQQAHRQTANETILAYYAIAISDEPISTRRLRRRCERIIREAIGVEVDFRVDHALERLSEMDRVHQSVDQKWSTHSQ
jgi:hypothetical protein